MNIGSLTSAARQLPNSVLGQPAPSATAAGAQTQHVAEPAVDQVSLGSPAGASAPMDVAERDAVAAPQSAAAAPAPAPRVLLAEVSETPTTPAPTLAEQLQAAGTGRVLTAGAEFHRRQVFALTDQLLDARDSVTGLVPLHLETREGRLVASDHWASGLDMGRQTAGLVMASRLAGGQGDSGRAERYLAAAEQNWSQGKKLLSVGDRFVHRRDFNQDGTPRTTELGEPGRSAAGQDNASRVNPRAYAFRAAGELFEATGKSEYRADFDRFFQAWVADFHDPVQGGFFTHSNLDAPSDHTERGSFKEPGGAPSSYDGARGAKGNDGTVYALSSVLLTANRVLGTPQTEGLVRESMDLLLNRFHGQNGMLWENYSADFQPLAQDWQSQPLSSRPEVASHVAIGGHTAMAPQQIIEGARQLRDQGALSEADYASYVDRSLGLLQNFLADSGAVDWTSGAVHNAIRVEEPVQEQRWIKEWGDASWQQAELLQTLIRVAEEGRLGELRGPDGKNGHDLLAAAQRHFEASYSLPANYSFSDAIGNPDVYHRPQVADYFASAAAK